MCIRDSSNTPEERFFGNYAESLIPVIGTVKAGYGALAFEAVSYTHLSLRSMPLSPFGTCVPPPPAGGVFPSRGGFGIP